MILTNLFICMLLDSIKLFFPGTDVVKHFSIQRLRYFEEQGQVHTDFSLGDYLSHFKFILQFTVSNFIWFFSTNYISCVYIFIPLATHKYSGLCNSLYNHCYRSLLYDILVFWTAELHTIETKCRGKTWGKQVGIFTYMVIQPAAFIC
jgi:hypothetical protein